MAQLHMHVSSRFEGKADAEPGVKSQSMMDDRTYDKHRSVIILMTLGSIESLGSIQFYCMV